MMIRNCTFGFKCATEWEQLNETSSPDVRFCLDCEKEVHFCRTDEQLAQAIRLNRCVAVELAESTVRYTVGIPG
jgi:hypothetical protein